MRCVSTRLELLGARLQQRKQLKNLVKHIERHTQVRWVPAPQNITILYKTIGLV